MNLASTYGGTCKINARKIIIDGQLRGDSAGYAGGVATKGAGTGGGRPGTGTAGAGGGAYGGGGGLAGYCCNDTPARGQGGDAYGTIDADDIDAGSGGAGASSVFTKGIGGNGGAGFALTANSISIKGTISAIGGLGSFQYACSGGGAGGGLLLSANDITLDTIGKILMVGGEGGSNPGVGMSGGGGGGGRVKFLAQQVVNKYGLVNVKGGKGGVGSGETEHGVKGEEGSYYEAIVDRKEPIVVVSEGLTPSLALKASKPKICVGQELKFTAIAGNGGDAPTFQWKLNGADVAGATTFTYSGTDFKDGDKVSCTMQSNAACASAQTMANSDTFTINVLALADANFTTNYPYGAPGITITFTSATKGANTKRVWDFGDGFIAYDDEVIEHSFELEGIYTIKHLVNNGACVDTFSQDFLVKPLDSFVINGINNKQGESKLSVFPNPSKGHLFIAFKGASGEAISASINDLSGKQVHAITWINQINSPKKIDFDGFAKGIYIVKVNDGKQVYVQKLFLD